MEPDAKPGAEPDAKPDAKPGAKPGAGRSRQTIRQTVAYWLARHARLQPAKVAVRHGGRSITFEELNRRVNRLAHALSKRSVEPKDRIAVLMYNRLEVLEVFFACAKLGAVCVPLNFRLAAEELEQLVTDAGACGLFFEEEFRPNADRIREMLSPPILSSPWNKAGPPTRPTKNSSPPLPQRNPRPCKTWIFPRRF